ncbi:sialidase family protein [Kamptonema cortianum]|nr:sialidase family protein [Geitlerinema splendidum]MDK3158663.1 sialidase family protein [Kamptonema cortianum]
MTSDDKGRVFVTSHIPTQVFVSNNWGESFKLTRTFEESLGDMVALPLGGDKVMAVFMPPKINGLLTRLSVDGGLTWKEGTGIMGRPLDREWPAKHPSGAVFMVYSDGYIGGPESKGIFIARSDDDGLSWKEITRVDNEPAGVFAIDPHIAILESGRICVLWTTSTDKNTIDQYRVAVSDDLGVTFKHKQTIAEIKKTDGDTQERWMLGCLAGYGKTRLAVVYSRHQQVGGANTLLTRVRVSENGGETFGEEQLAVPQDYLQESVATYKRPGVNPAEVSHYIQCEPWADYDTNGNLHLVWYDNRLGQVSRGSSRINTWQTFHTVLGNGKPSAISSPFQANRPPMDFLSCNADSRFVHAAWTENDGATRGWAFTGKLMFARKLLSN